MIKSNKALSMAEASKYISDASDETRVFIKEFISISPEQATELREKLLSLELIQLNEKHIAKLIDMLPTDKEGMSKILSDINFDENETNNILSAIKELK